MMDESYRILDSPPNLYSPDLDASLLGGEPSHGHKTKPPALSTTRLKVFRQVTRGAILSILETGHVSVEFLKRKGDQDRLAELMVISGDGQEICVEQWKTEGSSMNNDLTSHSGEIERTWKTFTYSSLPERYWKKYSHACRFVDLVKSKTAKVTMYSDRAKGVLMENWPPNFEVTFFQGPKIVMCGSEVHIREDSGASLLFHRDALNSLVNNYTMGLIQHATQMREQCLRLEASVTTVQAMSPNNEPLFPITVGMRPSTSFCSSTSSNSGSMDLLSSPRFTHLHSSPSSGSQGHPASPPSSPGAHIDLRRMDPLEKPTPTSHPSSMDAKTPQSPFRHISTLEGRKFRRQVSDSTDSSYIHYANSLSTGHCSPDLRHPPVCLPENIAQEPAGTANALSPEEIQQNQKLSSEALRCPGGDHAQQMFAPPLVSSSASPQQQTPMYRSAPQGTPTTYGHTGHDPHQLMTNKENVRETTRDGNMTAPCFITDSQPMLTSLARTTTSLADEDTGEETSAVVRQTFVAYTGWASQHANGTIWIRYNEGTQLGVYRDQPEVVYVDQQGNRHRYLQSDNIPEVVRQKLEKLPTVIESLKKRPSTSPYTLTST